ncbi:hypothetical protein IWX50DRAFT_483120 [Phyllosticta citricarpa]
MVSCPATTCKTASGFLPSPRMPRLWVCAGFGLLIILLLLFSPFAGRLFFFSFLLSSEHTCHRFPASERARSIDQSITTHGLCHHHAVTQRRAALHVEISSSERARMRVVGFARVLDGQADMSPFHLLLSSLSFFFSLLCFALLLPIHQFDSPKF